MSNAIRLSGLIILLASLLSPAGLRAQEMRPHSMLVLDQSDRRGPFYYQVFVGLRDAVSAHGHASTTIYTESLDLNRFGGEAYQDGFRRFLEAKYRDRPIGVVVSVGAAALELALRWRSQLWPNAPIVFAMVEENDFKRLRPPAYVTGGIVTLKLKDAVRAARAVVPDLKTVVLVGAEWDRQVLFRNWKDHAAADLPGLDLIEIIGRPMPDVIEQVGALPDRSAIIHTGLYSDGKGNYYPPSDALAFVAAKANRPIVVGAETFLKPGGIGGFVVVPSLIGAEAAQRALRILDGEAPENLPPSVIDAVKPIFNWQQMQRWNVSEASLPQGSEIRFREPTFLEKYRWRAVAFSAALLFQTVLIAFLLHERYMRRKAEVEARNRLSQLAHSNRQATAGELSSSIAHELNQPLGSILTNAETAELILGSPTPDLQEVREIISDIKRDDLRASEVIRRMRSLLKRAPFEKTEIDLNQIMREAFDFLKLQASARNVAIYLQTSPQTLRVKGDPVQLQQVILNLVVNSMDAMGKMPYGRTIIGRTEVNGGASAVISICDSGPGIPTDRLNEIFDPFFTTKEQGMGIGLSIARTIVLAHSGQIWAENQSGGGAAFHLSLPLAA
ncbi:sensor histidine kinase [Bradyrhizobium sp. AUGA SZCCT0051]|nr:sensor histidine kinase [Bradyrhizobium sp. AUGA SZCCT0124]MBR1314396.1 sensor histidine kinase [Bradyrhizobium sp. AUGA SZCCT0051]MBR1342586.1 sensor histidine kinase [Bradyrhizobium sp. AUGA SZCCT0105]MBR1352815.1 sensor histidine kinase [Bradyrhizobium sp. AUGA SZCCT0045]